MDVDSAIPVERTQSQSHVNGAHSAVDEGAAREPTAVVVVRPCEPDVVSAPYVMHKECSAGASAPAGGSSHLLSVKKRYIVHAFSVNTHRGRIRPWLRLRDQLCSVSDI